MTDCMPIANNRSPSNGGEGGHALSEMERCSPGATFTRRAVTRTRRRATRRARDHSMNTARTPPSFPLARVGQATSARASPIGAIANGTDPTSVSVPAGSPRAGRHAPSSLPGLRYAISSVCDVQPSAKAPVRETANSKSRPSTGVSVPFAEARRGRQRPRARQLFGRAELWIAEQPAGRSDIVVPVEGAGGDDGLAGGGGGAAEAGFVALAFHVLELKSEAV